MCTNADIILLSRLATVQCVLSLVLFTFSLGGSNNSPSRTIKTSINSNNNTVTLVMEVDSSSLQLESSLHPDSETQQSERLDPPEETQSGNHR